MFKNLNITDEAPVYHYTVHLNHLLKTLCRWLSTVRDETLGHKATAVDIVQRPGARYMDWLLAHSCHRMKKYLKAVKGTVRVVRCGFCCKKCQ